MSSPVTNFSSIKDDFSALLRSRLHSTPNSSVESIVELASNAWASDSPRADCINLIRDCMDFNASDMQRISDIVSSLFPESRITTAPASSSSTTTLIPPPVLFVPSVRISQKTLPNTEQTEDEEILLKEPLQKKSRPTISPSSTTTTTTREELVRFSPETKKEIWDEVQRKTVPRSQLLTLRDNEVRCRWNYVCPKHTAIKSADPFSDKYIHANYVTDPKIGQTLIAAQGPTKEMAPTFWHHVWDHNSSIIDLSGEDFGYAPPQFATQTHGDYQISRLSTVTDKKVEHHEYSVRSLSARSQRFIARHVALDWPARSIIPVEQLRDLVDLVEKAYAGSHSVIIHCSSGLSRTGTLVTAYYLAQEIRAGLLTPSNLRARYVELLTRLRSERGDQFVMEQAQSDLILEFAQDELNRRANHTHPLPDPSSSTTTTFNFHPELRFFRPSSTHINEINQSTTRIIKASSPSSSTTTTTSQKDIDFAYNNFVLQFFDAPENKRRDLFYSNANTLKLSPDALKLQMQNPDLFRSLLANLDTPPAPKPTVQTTQSSTTTTQKPVEKTSHFDSSKILEKAGDGPNKCSFSFAFILHLGAALEKDKQTWSEEQKEKITTLITSLSPAKVFQTREAAISMLTTTFGNLRDGLDEEAWKNSSLRSILGTVLGDLAMPEEETAE